MGSGRDSPRPIIWTATMEYLTWRHGSPLRLLHSLTRNSEFGSTLREQAITRVDCHCQEALALRKQNISFTTTTINHPHECHFDPIITLRVNHK